MMYIDGLEIIYNTRVKMCQAVDFSQRPVS
jgi:hypothetical protein